MLHVGWAIVLGSAVLLLGGKLASGHRWRATLLVMLWTVWPGPASPAHWLGLAFQSPSLTSIVICVGWLVHQARRRQGPTDWLAQLDLRALNIELLLGIVLGWFLLLDTMAWLPVSLYAWGFGSSAFSTVLAFAALLWLLRGSLASALPLMVLALYASSRLPTGNVWDALLDPWLWLVLQIGYLVSVVRRR